MKLLFVVQNFRQDWGGGPESVRLMARALAGRGVSCDVLDRARLHRSVERLTLLPADAGEADRFDPAEIVNYSAVLQVGPWQNPLQLRQLLSRIKGGQRHFYLPRGGVADIEFRDRGSLKKHSYFTLLERQFAARADGIILSSEAELRASRRLDGIASPKFTIPDFVEAIEPLPPNDERDQPSDAFTLGFLAAVAPRKGLLPLLEGIAILEKKPLPGRVRVNIGGGGRTGTTAYLERVHSVSQRLVRIEVNFLGPVMQKERAHFYSETDAFLVPSLFESYGLTVLEALSSGCKVLSSPHVGIREFLSESPDLGILPDVSPEAIAVAIETMLRERPAGWAERRRIAERASIAIEAINARALRQWMELLA